MLKEEFRRFLADKGFAVKDYIGEDRNGDQTVLLGLVSHIGGHKFAGNVIVYLPIDWRGQGQTKPNPLGEVGIWYGRVEPKHVRGIVEETVLGRRVIADLLRGAVDDKGGLLGIE